jgi:hypothetical protein
MPFNCTYSLSLTHSLTPWCRTLFEKLPITQLVKKYFASLWKLKVHYRAYKSPSPDPILSKIISPGPRLFETFHNWKDFYGEVLLVPRPTPSWRTTSCRLSVTAYSTYSQLPSVSRGLPSIHNLRTCHAFVSQITVITKICNIMQTGNYTGIQVN